MRLIWDYGLNSRIINFVEQVKGVHCTVVTNGEYTGEDSECAGIVLTYKRRNAVRRSINMKMM